MSQAPHASASTSLGGKTSDVIADKSDFFVIGLEDDYIFTPKNKKAYEELLNEEAFIRYLFETRSACISEYEIAKDTYGELLRQNRVDNGRAYLVNAAAQELDGKRQALFEIDAKLNQEITVQAPGTSEKKTEEPAPPPLKPVSKIATAGNNLKEIIVAKKDGGTKKTLVRSKVMANHFRTYKLTTEADLGKGSKSFIKDNKIDWDEFKSHYKASNISKKLKSDMPWVGDWIKSCNKDIVLRKYAAACNAEIDAGISAQLSFSAEAQFLRAATSLAWTYEYDLKKGRLSTRIDGGVYATLAEAKSTASFSAPRNGIALRLADINLGIIRASITVEGSAGVGATIAGALYVDVDASRKTIAKLPSSLSAIRSTEPGSVADLSGLPGGKAGVSASAFAGASVDASIAGALEWKSPEVVNGKENEFKSLASIKPGLSATAGAGVELDYYFDFTDGVFRIFCKAALCVGIGAKGNIGLEVDTNQIGNFMICAYHQICSSKFIASKLAAVGLTALSLSCLLKGIDNAYNMTMKWYEDITAAWAEESKRIDIMHNITENPDILKYTVPAAKGVLIHFLMNSPWWAGLRPSNDFDSLRDWRLGSNPRKRAIILIFTWVQSKEEFREVMKNIKERIDSPSIPWTEGFDQVSDFLGEWEWLPAFTAPYIGSDYEGNLQRFYERLHDKHPVGYPVIRNDMEEYLARSELSPSYMYPVLDSRGEFREQMLAQAQAHHNESIG